MNFRFRTKVEYNTYRMNKIGKKFKMVNSLIQYREGKSGQNLNNSTNIAKALPAIPYMELYVASFHFMLVTANLLRF